MTTWFFMISAIFLALVFLGMDVATKAIGKLFDAVCEAVKRARAE